MTVAVAPVAMTHFFLAAVGESIPRPASVSATPCTGQTVRAIFATTAGYTVIREGGHVDLSRRQIYEAVPFD